MIDCYKFRRKKAQTFIEYTIIIGIVVSVLVAMTPMIRRGVQSMVKLVADQIGYQQNADQPGGEQGHLVNSISIVRTDSISRKTELLGITNYIYGDRSDSITNFIANAGFTKTR